MAMYDGPAAPYRRQPLLWFGSVVAERSYRESLKSAWLYSPGDKLKNGVLPYMESPLSFEF